MTIPTSTHPLRIGFVGTRFSGTDGVSLETEKWSQVLKRLGHSCFYFCGSSNQGEEISYVVPEASLFHPENEAISRVSFTERVRPPETTIKIQRMKDGLKQHLVEFVNKFEIQAMIVENALSIPMHLPLGLAITEFLAETGLPTIGHHHDMFWERKRFLVNCVWDYLNMAFPPHLPNIEHVVINTSAANQLALRTGISSTLIPNVMDFDHPPPPPDDYTRDIREAVGLQTGEYLILQPTRVVQRKGIEHAIELVQRLELNARLIISHDAGDEGYEYEEHIRQYARRLGVPTLFVADIIKEQRGKTKDGRKIYTLADLYPYADLVTYPSDLEGFGNAFLEAVYYRRPIVVNNYSIYAIDINPKGFDGIEFDGYITEQTVNRAREILLDPQAAQAMTEHNYQLARHYYSYSTLEQYLDTLLARLFGR